jgi:hypothetical protein
MQPLLCVFTNNEIKVEHNLGGLAALFVSK